MTSSATTAAILVLFDGTTPAANVIAFTAEITRMTAGTEWRVLKLIGIIVPINTTAYRSFVTASTTRIPSVVARVVPLRAMAKDVRCPAVCCMTHVTLFIRAYMTAAETVTVRAIAGSAGIVEPGATDEGRSGMAEVAIQPGRDVGAVHACRRITVVAGRAIVHDAGMIKHCADEGSGVMTDTAILIG